MRVETGDEKPQVQEVPQIDLPVLGLVQLIAKSYGRRFGPELAERLLERVAVPSELPAQTVTRLANAPEGSFDRCALVNLVTVGETYFFREHSQFSALEDELLQKVADLTNDRPIQVWSAGTSTGEEAYSIAISALRVFGKNASKRVNILATDLNPSYIERAKRGQYQQRSFRGIAPESLNPFVVEVNGSFQVSDAVKSLVDFRVHNLVTAAPYAEFLNRMVDVLACRNVGVYFEKETLRTVGRRLAEVVAPGGYLLLGPAETVLHDSGALRLEKRGETFVFHRPVEAKEGFAAEMPVPPAVRKAEFRRATGYLSSPGGAAPALHHGGTGPLQPLPFRDDVPEELPPEEGRLAQAAMLIDMGDYAGAAVLCHSALEEDNFRPAAHFMLGLARRLQGSYQEAVHQFRAAAYLQPDDWLAPFHLAESYRAIGSPQEALREYKSCLARMDSVGEEPAPALLGGFSPEYFRRASARQIGKLTGKPA